MDSDYDRKFQEMKKYIPFLEGMINKLESSNLPINPRQAHLDKIKSLRDLLENKKKRMKMENLLKCEQVLINLYAKVEQTDLKREGNKTGSKNTDLNTVRNKLKSIVTKLDQDDTSRSVTGDEVVDSAQTSLFERRSSKSCSTPVKEPLNDNKKNSPQASKRNYTRVLLSPERSDQKWSDDENPKTEKLYSRRSPRRISNKYSPTYKKERKKSKKLKDLQSKDLNITLNVPEESLSSLDTEDILSRIINCSDSDVDITTLRELRTQILGELKQTGVKDDISDLLLKSCKKNTAIEKKCEVEEGELSDSESETIENIYGSLVIVDKEKTTKDSVGKDKSRKIQICLVINSDKKGDNSLDHDKSNCVISGEASSFESYPVEKTRESDLKESKVSSEKVAVKKEEIQHHVKDEQPCRHLEYEGIVIKKDNKCDEIIKSQIEITKEEKETNDNRTEMSRDINDDKILEDNVISTNKNEQYFAPNFYKHDNDNKTITNTTSKSHKLDKSAVKIEDESNQTQETIQSPVEIPLLDLEASKKQQIVSEIDILQALKKEILGESPSSTTVENTPLLHQPKISKVSSAKEIVKKRISIENYKEKCHSSTEPRKPLFFREANKKRIQLTDKECERFNLPKKISFNDDDDNSIVSLGEIYSDLAPKSPDHDDFADTGIKPPVIIPSDPVEPTVVCSLLDVDMRHVSITPQILTGTTPASSISENTDKTKLSDPRKSRWESSSTKRENILPSFNPIDNPNQTLQSTLQTPCNSILNPNMAPLTPNRTPVFVPNARTYEVTPSRPSHDAEEIPTRKHVYAPSFSVANSFDTNDKNERFSMDNSSTPIWELNPIADVDNFDTNDSYGRLERSTTPVRSFDRFDCPSTPLPSFGRMECPTTPLPSFGRTERAMTPINSYSHFENSATTVHPFLRRGEGSATPVHSFGRSDGSTTPIHTFGHSDSSSTPSHIFGRSEGSITPVFSFNRSEDSPTPSYMYGRSDGSTTPAHAFGRSDSLGAPQSFDVSRSDSYRRSAKPPYRRHDPRLNRSYDHDNYNRPEDEKDYGYNRNPQFFSDYQSDQRFSESSSGCSQNYGRREFNRSRGRRGDWSYKDSYKSDREPSANRFIRKDRDSYRFRKKNSNYNERNLEKSIDKKHSADREREKAYTSLRKIDVSNVPSESRTLAIDTRVNTTFQGTNITLSSFDKRRQRAASVGRILTHEPSLGINKNTVTRKSETAESETRKRFLRASSVGREFHTNVSSSFKDVKADLRSFKLTNDYIVRKSTVDFKAENNSIKLNHAKGINERYSPRKNNRDPRMRRESRFDRAENSKVKTSPIGDTKKSGIVYTDSNISAGAITIGASSSVKNYKIPKIKRSPEKTVVSENVQEHEPSSTKLITKENSSSENNSKTNTESKEIVVYVTSKDTGEFQKEILKFQRNDNDINDSKEIELQKVKDLYKSVNENASSSYHRGAEKVDSSETLERRVTRSATNNTNVTDVSPSKSIRKYKRTIIYEDSDSDDKNDKSNNAMSQRKNTTVERGVEIKKVNIEDTSQQSSTMKNSNRLMPVVDVNLDVVLPQSEKNYKSEVNYEDIIANPDINNLTSSGCNVTTIDKSSEKVALKLENTAETTVAENNKDRNKTINNETNEITPSNTPYSTQKLDEKTSDYMAEHTNKESHINDNTEDPEPNKESDEFHSNFADLEIFSDTITTDPVLDNINALIADLDHDLDVEKNNESRGPFTQEITMENMLENITVNSMNSNDKINKPDENVSIEVNDISKNINSSASISSKNNENIYEQKTGEVKDSLINNDSNDATVSTTKEEVQSLKDKNNETREKNTTVDSLATPDSTINIENQSKLADENVPDSTNDFNDISSSNLISETQNKKSPNSHQSERAERSDSIGNFLSILQDKTKIKEVLSLLGDSSSEHAKIKRKLEKLSEIVSDDEENDNGSKDAVTNKNNKNKTECTLNKDSYNEVTEIQVNTVVENLDKKDKEEEAINDPKNVEFHETPHNLHSSKDSFQQAKEPEIGVEPLTSPKQLVEKEVKIQKRGRKQKTLNKGVASIKNAKKNTSVIPKTKKPSREVLNLQADIREMFLKDDKEILDGTTGLRMCRLAKLVDSKSQNDKSQNLQEDIIKTSSNDNSSDIGDKNIKKKTAKKSKSLNSTDRNASSEKVKIYEDLNSQSSTKSMYTNENESQKDPYVFETESVGESICTSEKKDDSSEYDSESSLGPDSCKSDLPERRTPEAKKKTKRKRSAWQSGVIVPKNKKKKNQISKIKTDSDPLPKLAFEAKLLDPNCYIDKLYCFSKNDLIYDCRLCSEKDSAIVHHYKTKHPHSEIPLSRMSPDVAQEAIKQCEKIDFQAIGAVPSQRYVCRFCFKEFASCKSFESFFWHVVSVHTGEYKYDCSICDTDKVCPFSLDIPPPPNKEKGHVTGYVCGNCNYTQISLENLKSHVISRHNDEKTEVYTINLSHMSTKSINTLLKRPKTSKEEQRVLRSSRSNISPDLVDYKEKENDMSNTAASSNLQDLNIENIKGQKKNQSKITFENDTDYDNITKLSMQIVDRFKVKEEKRDIEVKEAEVNSDNGTDLIPALDANEGPEEGVNESVKDINELPHFNVTFTETGSKQYVCCINQHHNHYKTSLMISFKKHVASHSEKWDGYCHVCKAIVMPQGAHLFKTCLQHFTDNHPDGFPVLESLEKQVIEQPAQPSASPEPARSSPKPFLSVRPLAELISKAHDTPTIPGSPLPVIKSVMSLGDPHISGLPAVATETPTVHLYEEAQAEIMLKKNRIILDTMLSYEKLVHVFKCAGRFCSYTTDSAEDALHHVTTHSRVGGENALKCAYCDFNSLDNAIDLVTHVFKSHGFCQYACCYCFYRAVSSQMVNAHIDRIHATMPVKKVLKTSFTTEPPEDSQMLSREDAVPHYVCNCDEDNSKCKFKTYTPGKLCEHMKSKHPNAEVYECYICQLTSQNVAEIIHHYKTHGLKLYQCARCVFGADSEKELLTHASIYHSIYQPQAYLRVITNKEGTKEYRVLPLAHLNKTNALTIDVPPSSIRDNPVREAERSVDLEKLIGHTATYREPASEPSADGPSEQSPEGRALDTILDFAPEVRPCTPPVPIALEQQTTPIIKQESMIRASTTPQQTSSDIICIDSDEDGLDVSSASNISTTSNVPAEVEIQSKPMTFPLSYLYKCSECGSLSKNAVGFRQHLKGCFENRDIVPCAFCQFKGRKSRIVTHYNKTHQVKLTNNMRHDCGDCGATFMSTEAIKKHHKDEHDATEINIINKVVDKVKIREVTKRVTLRRKSAASIGGEPPAKMKKFGPQDVNLLPINPIFDESIHCSLCEFSTKVRLNMVRHLQLHANQQPVPQTAPVNPVPHLETNEKHFDKMVNLASSSLLTRQDKNIRSEPVVTHMISPDKTSRYPKYVPERTRHTCGAKNCLYISSDESMLKYHWETLHSGSNDFHCVHCPPYQTLDTKTPLTASRIIAHLRMHDVRLYACSRCTFYHYKRQVVERHMNEIHKECKVMTVREEAKEVVPQATAAPAPTMDLKPWQCGLCEFKSLLRPEVSEHCAKLHNSKMQFKCVYCAFRTSNIENVTKHQAKSHQGKPAVTFYFYYREGSIPEPDGLPFWEMQRNKYNLTETKVKTEKATSPTPIAQTTTIQSDAPVVNLNIVKQEAKETSEDSMEELCERFGQFCEPNGLKYKCPLCKQVIEDTKVAMQSHLFEELQYRKWSCSICFYKAFHRQGLTEHMQSEHHQNRDPVELPVDVRVETWVTKLLEHQEAIINLAKEKFDQQKAEIRKNTEPLQQQKVQTQASSPSRNAQDKPNKEELERQFGALGQSKSMSFCCPKCNELIKEECNMRDHLESELNKIRWCCSVCPKTFQSYHQAQFHCKTHLGQSSRPLEAPRDSTLRTAWVDAVLECQKLSMNCETPEKHSESPEPPENSLLVVRYEETVPTPEIQATSNRDSDDERLVIAEQQRGRKRKATLTCDHCPFISSNKKTLTEHLLRHYGLKPYICVYCKLTGPLRSLQKHQKIYHAMKPMKIETTEVPNEPPNEYLRKNKKVQSFAYCVCLTCQSPVMEMDVSDHIHDNIEPEFGRFGEVIVRCSTCNTLHKDIGKFQEHSKIKHPNDGNYVFYKLSHEHRPNQACTLCPQKFSLKKDLRAHIEAMHAKSMEYATIERRLSKDVIVLDDEEDTLAEVTPSPRRKVARKSTTKLPWTKSVARKSTTKLPMNYNEYSFYGTTFSADGLENVTTLMPFYNTVVPVTFQRLSDILNVNPRVVVKKMEKPISEHVNK